ncbi:hypothetical protein ACMDCR_23310 [Labrys okinawensis]|uniref:hypothetical protein n=1 Tax=Labrys okinawensis TaxID=346911 RepID=UPI0039BC21FD
MSDVTLTIGWNEAQTARALRIYRLVLGFNMLGHLAIGLACIFCPLWVSQTLGLPEPIPTGWVRGWGAMLLLVTMLYIPGLLDPLITRAPNVIGVLGRYWMMLIWIFCGGSFLWFALIDGAFATLLGLLYRRLLMAKLMTHP